MKNANSIKIATSFVVGALFAAGLIISGMTDPTVIAGFFDFAGNWMPALLFVMVGAVAIHAPLTYFITKKSHPLFDKKFYLSDRLDIDAPLVIGAIFFGLGWGIAAKFYVRRPEQGKPFAGLIYLMKCSKKAIVRHSL